MNSFLDLTNFLLDLCNFHEDDGAILIFQSHRLSNKKLSQTMNFHCLTILSMLSSRSNRNRIPKELFFLDEGSLVVFTLLLTRVEEWIHMKSFVKRSGPLVGHGYLPGSHCMPWPRPKNSWSRSPMKSRGASSSLHATVSHSGREWGGMRVT